MPENNFGNTVHARVQCNDAKKTIAILGNEQDIKEYPN